MVKQRPNHPAQRTCAVVLAGGRGSRLCPLTGRRSKPAVPFAGQLKIIDFALSNCVNSGIRRIGVLTQYMAQSLIRHIERGWSFLASSLGECVDVEPAQQQPGEGWCSGTANAMHQNFDLIREADFTHELVPGGDHVCKMDGGLMLAEPIARDSQLSVACIEVPIEQASTRGVMAVDERGHIVAFEEKPAWPTPVPGDPHHALASMGLCIFNTAVLSEQPEIDAADPLSSHDFGRDLIPRRVRQRKVTDGPSGGRDPDKLCVCAHRFQDSCANRVDGRPCWRDVGTVDAFWEANIDLTHVVPELNLYDDDWPILSLQRQLPPAKFVIDEASRRSIAIDTLVSGGCIVSGAVVRRSIHFSKLRVGEGSMVEDSVVLPNVIVGRDMRLSRAIIGKPCTLPDGFRAGLDPAADHERGLHVTPLGSTLVSAEMPGQAARVG